MKVVRLKTELPDKEVDKLAGKFLDESHYDQLIDEQDCKVLTPAGDPLLVFRYNVLPAGQCKAAYPVLRKAAGLAGNRGLAAGHYSEDKPIKVDNRNALLTSPSRAHPIKKDGTVSNTSYAQKVESGIIGYFDRYPRIPYCRLTAFNLHHPEKFALALPLIKTIDNLFKKEMPDRYAAQLKMVRKTSQDFVIHGTSFSTVTVNRNFRTACHKDVGDLAEGFGVMTCFSAGNYQGGYLVFPKYRVAVNMRTRSLLLANVHEWHGNSPIVGVRNCYERISLVLYYREKMAECGSAEEEMERAKKLGIRAGKGQKASLIKSLQEGPK
jgi:hypothetical protein